MSQNGTSNKYIFSGGTTEEMSGCYCLVSNHHLDWVPRIRFYLAGSGCSFSSACGLVIIALQRKEKDSGRRGLQLDVCDIFQKDNIRWRRVWSFFWEVSAFSSTMMWISCANVFLVGWDRLTDRYCSCVCGDSAMMGKKGDVVLRSRIECGSPKTCWGWSVDYVVVGEAQWYRIHTEHRRFLLENYTKRLPWQS